MTIKFRLAGQEFVGLNGGPHFRFTEAISFVVNCETQAEIDEFSEKLSAGGETSHCGSLQDKFGLSWQIVPAVLEEMPDDANPERSQPVMQALLMDKLDLAVLKEAARSI